VPIYDSSSKVTAGQLSGICARLLAYDLHACAFPAGQQQDIPFQDRSLVRGPTLQAQCSAGQRTGAVHPCVGVGGVELHHRRDVGQAERVSGQRGARRGHREQDVGGRLSRRGGRGVGRQQLAPSCAQEMVV